MAGGMDKGLASSIWAPLHTGRPPYRFNKSTAHTISTPASAHTNARAHHSDTTLSSPSTPSPSTNNDRFITPATNATAAASHVDLLPRSASPCQIDLTSALGRIPTPWAELTRYNKIVRRLEWKLPFLAQGYNAATDRNCSTDEQREEAELMFKLDFFEYYMLLERALVHLLGVFGIKVTGGIGDRPGGVPTGPRRGIVHERWEQSDHRFHANVLEALDDPRNPLHEALGVDDVRFALARAKELRNRWKNADDLEVALAARLVNGSKATRPLEDYDLGQILKTTFSGFNHGFQIAERYVNEVRVLAAERGVAGSAAPANEQAEEWEFITDAMDWEAV